MDHPIQQQDASSPSPLTASIAPDITGAHRLNLKEERDFIGQCHRWGSQLGSGKQPSSWIVAIWKNCLDVSGCVCLFFQFPTFLREPQGTTRHRNSGPSSLRPAPRVSSVPELRFRFQLHPLPPSLVPQWITLFGSQAHREVWKRIQARIGLFVQWGGEKSLF